MVDFFSHQEPVSDYCCCCLLLLFVCSGEKFETSIFFLFQGKMATWSGIIITPDSFPTFRDTMDRINDDHLGKRVEVDKI